MLSVTNKFTYTVLEDSKQCPKKENIIRKHSGKEKSQVLGIQ